MTTFSDIFKSSFLENVASVSLVDMLITMALAFGMGVFIFFVYKKTYAGVMYSASFGATLVALTMITSMTILAVTSNVVLSLGMVGAADDAEAEKRAVQFLGEHVEKASVKSKTAQSGNIEFTCEVRLKGDDTAFITALSEMEGVNSAVLVSYNGDYMG